VRRVGLIHRKDKALSKAALGFIQVILERAAESEITQNALTNRAGGAHGDEELPHRSDFRHPGRRRQPR